MPRAYRLSTSSHYSICDQYSQDWVALDEKREDIAIALNSPDSSAWLEALKHVRPSDWNVEDVVGWCQTTSLAPEVADWFRMHEINGKVLQSLTEADLLAMGMEPFGRRRQLILMRDELMRERASPSRISTCTDRTKAGDFSCASSKVTTPQKTSEADPWWMAEAKAAPVMFVPSPLRSIAKRIDEEAAASMPAAPLAKPEAVLVEPRPKTLIVAAPLLRAEKTRADENPSRQDLAPGALPRNSSSHSWAPALAQLRDLGTSRAAEGDRPRSAMTSRSQSSLSLAPASVKPLRGLSAGCPPGRCGDHSSGAMTSRSWSSWAPPLAQPMRGLSAGCPPGLSVARSSASSATQLMDGDMGRRSLSYASSLGRSSSYVPPSGIMQQGCCFATPPVPRPLIHARPLVAGEVGASSRSTSQSRSLAEIMCSKADALGSAWAIASRESSAAMREASATRKAVNSSSMKNAGSVSSVEPRRMVCCH